MAENNDSSQLTEAMSTISIEQQEQNNKNEIDTQITSTRLSDIRDDPRNLYVDNLPSLSDVELRNLFLPYGAILKSRVVIDPVTRACAGYGFVMFERSDDAAKAIAGLNQHTLGTKKLRVTIKRNKDRANQLENSAGIQVFHDKFSNGKVSNQSTPHPSPDIKSHSLIITQHPSQSDATSSLNSPTSTNLYVAGIPVTWMKSDVDNLFQAFGQIVDSRVLIDRSTGRNRGKAMVRLSSNDECDAAIKALDQCFIPPQLSQPIIVQYASDKESSQQQPKSHKLLAAEHTSDLSHTSDSSSTSHISSQNGSSQHSHPRSTAHDTGSPSSHRSSSPLSYHSHSSARYAYAVPTHEMNGTGRHSNSPGKLKQMLSNPEYSAVGMAAFHTAPLPPSAYHTHPSLVVPTPPYLMSPHQATSVWNGMPSPASTPYHPSLMQHHSYLEQQHQHAQYAQHQQHQPSPTLHPHTALPASSVRLHPSLNGRTDNHNESLNLPSAINARTSTSLYVYGLPSAITEADLERLFGIYGGVSSVRLMKHENGAPRGFAFVNMNSVQEAEIAIHYLDQFPLGGRILQVQFKTLQSQKQVQSQPNDNASDGNVLQ